MIDMQKGVFAGAFLVLTALATSGCYTELGGAAADDPDAGVALQQGALTAPEKEMQAKEMTSNAQYLQLQAQMQSENRSYTLLSNIMKTKHDTVKSSISNVR